ncbi:MAG: DUF3891 family protein [Actinomycetota bacterium]
MPGGRRRRMIVARTAGRLRLVTQVAHQVQCGLLVAPWGNDEFARPEPWAPVVEATAWHDEGWREWEAHPQVLPDGEPLGFVAMELGDHVAIHRASAAAAATRGDRVELLVGMHGAGLVMRRLGLDGEVERLDDRPEPARDLVIDRARAGRALRSGLGEGADLAGWTWSAYRILQAIDLLSLYLTWRGLAGGEEWSRRRVPRCPGDECGVDIAVRPAPPDGPAPHDEAALACMLDPWPFATDLVQAPVEARFIDDRPYRDADELADALASASVEVLEMLVRRA